MSNSRSSLPATSSGLLAQRDLGQPCPQNEGAGLDSNKVLHTQVLASEATIASQVNGESLVVYSRQSTTLKSRAKDGSTIQRQISSFYKRDHHQAPMESSGTYKRTAADFASIPRARSQLRAGVAVSSRKREKSNLRGSGALGGSSFNQDQGSSTHRHSQQLQQLRGASRREGSNSRQSLSSSRHDAIGARGLPAETIVAKSKQVDERRKQSSKRGSTHASGFQTTVARKECPTQRNASPNQSQTAGEVALARPQQHQYIGGGDGGEEQRLVHLLNGSISSYQSSVKRRGSVERRHHKNQDQALLAKAPQESFRESKFPTQNNVQSQLSSLPGLPSKSLTSRRKTTVTSGTGSIILVKKGGAEARDRILRKASLSKTREDSVKASQQINTTSFKDKPPRFNQGTDKTNSATLEESIQAFGAGGEICSQIKLKVNPALSQSVVEAPCSSEAIALTYNSQLPMTKSKQAHKGGGGSKLSPMRQPTSNPRYDAIPALVKSELVAFRAVNNSNCVAAAGRHDEASIDSAQSMTGNNKKISNRLMSSSLFVAKKAIKSVRIVPKKTSQAERKSQGGVEVKAAGAMLAGKGDEGDYLQRGLAPGKMSVDLTVPAQKLPTIQADQIKQQLQFSSLGGGPPMTSAFASSGDVYDYSNKNDRSSAVVDQPQTTSLGTRSKPSQHSYASLQVLSLAGHDPKQVGRNGAQTTLALNAPATYNGQSLQPPSVLVRKTVLAQAKAKARNGARKITQGAAGRSVSQLWTVQQSLTALERVKGAKMDSGLAPANGIEAKQGKTCSMSYQIEGAISTRSALHKRQLSSNQSTLLSEKPLPTASNPHIIPQNTSFTSSTKARASFHAQNANPQAQKANKSEILTSATALSQNAPSWRRYGGRASALTNVIGYSLYGGDSLTNIKAIASGTTGEGASMSGTKLPQVAHRTTAGAQSQARKTDSSLLNQSSSRLQASIKGGPATADDFLNTAKQQKQSQYAQGTRLTFDTLQQETSDKLAKGPFKAAKNYGAEKQHSPQYPAKSQKAQSVIKGLSPRVSASNTKSSRSRRYAIGTQSSEAGSLSRLQVPIPLDEARSPPLLNLVTTSLSPPVFKRGSSMKQQKQSLKADSQASALSPDYHLQVSKSHVQSKQSPMTARTLKKSLAPSLSPGLSRSPPVGVDNDSTGDYPMRLQAYHSRPPQNPQPQPYTSTKEHQSCSLTVIQQETSEFNRNSNQTLDHHGTAAKTHGQRACNRHSLKLHYTTFKSISNQSRRNSENSDRSGGQAERKVSKRNRSRQPHGKKDSIASCLEILSDNLPLTRQPSIGLGGNFMIAANGANQDGILRKDSLSFQAEGQPASEGSYDIMFSRQDVHMRSSASHGQDTYEAGGDEVPELGQTCPYVDHPELLVKRGGDPAAAGSKVHETDKGSTPTSVQAALIGPNVIICTDERDRDSQGADEVQTASLALSMQELKAKVRQKNYRHVSRDYQKAGGNSSVASKQRLRNDPKSLEAASSNKLKSHSRVINSQEASSGVATNQGESGASKVLQVSFGKDDELSSVLKRSPQAAQSPCEPDSQQRQLLQENQQRCRRTSSIKVIDADRDGSPIIANQIKAKFSSGSFGQRKHCKQGGNSNRSSRGQSREATPSSKSVRAKILQLAQSLKVPILTSKQDLVLKPDFKLTPLPIPDQLKLAKFHLGRWRATEISPSALPKLEKFDF